MFVKRYPGFRDPAIDAPWGKDEVSILAWCLLMLLVTSVVGNLLFWIHYTEAEKDKRACQNLLIDGWRHATDATKMP